MMDSKCVVCQSDILIPLDCNDDNGKQNNDTNGMDSSSIKYKKPGTSSSSSLSKESPNKEEKEEDGENVETEEALNSRTKTTTITTNSSSNSNNCKVHSHTRMMRIFCKYFDLEFHKNNKQILFLLNNDSDDDDDEEETENKDTEQQNKENIHWFCMECEDIMSEMYLLDQQLESIQFKIKNIMTNLTTKIIETDISISDSSSNSGSTSNVQQQSEDSNCTNQNTVNNNQNNHVQKNTNNADSPSTSLPSPRNTKSIVNELIRKKIRKSREANGENYSPQLMFDGFHRSPSSSMIKFKENLPLNLSKDVNDSDSEPIEDSTLEIEMYEGSPLLLPYPEIEIKERDEPFVMDFEEDDDNVNISCINQSHEEAGTSSEGHVHPSSSSNEYLLPRYSFNPEETDNNNMGEMDDDDSYPGIFGIVEEFRRSQMAQEEMQYSRQSATNRLYNNNHNHSTSNTEENHHYSSSSSSFNRSQTGDSPSSFCNKRRNNFSSYMSKVRNLGNGILIYDKTMSFQEIPDGFKCRYRQCTAIEKTIHAMIGHLVSHQEEKANHHSSTPTENQFNSDNFTETLNSVSSKEIPTTPTTNKSKSRPILKITPTGRKRSCDKKVSTPSSTFASPSSSSSTTTTSTSPPVTSNSKETAEELLLRSSSGVNQSGLKKWKCEACEFNFDFSGDLYLHIVRSHGSKVETPANIVQMLGPEKEKEVSKEEEKKKVKKQRKIKTVGKDKDKPKEKDKRKEKKVKEKEREQQQQQQPEKSKEEEKPKEKEIPKQKEPKLQCSRCGAKCQGVDALEVHLKRSLCRKKAQICPNCKEEFAQKWKLDIHLSTCAAPQGQEEDEKSKKKKSKKTPNDTNGNGNDSDSSSSIDAL